MVSDLDTINEKRQSDAISFLRFPLIVGVLFIHTYFYEDNVTPLVSDMLIQQGVLYYINILFSQVITRICVPLFFFISGFLFFYKTEWTKNTYLNKMRSRSKTLLMPYILWNILVFFLNERSLILDYSFLKFVTRFCASLSLYPANYQFWFIRDLMIVVVISPIIRFFLEKTKYFIVIFFILIWLLNIICYDICSICFFTLGAFFSINNKNIVVLFRRKAKTTSLIFIILVIIDMFSQSSIYNAYIHKMVILFGILFGFNSSYYFLDKLKVNIFLTTSAFFVYAAHEPILSKIRHYLFKYINPTLEWEAVCLYFLIPTITILICLGTYYLLTRYTPRVAHMLTGRG